MNWGILTAVLAYEIIVIVGLGLYFAKKQKKRRTGAFYCPTGICRLRWSL